MVFINVAADFFPKKRIGNPARIPPQTPPAGGNSAEAKRKILSPRKKDFRFAESVLKPYALPEYLEGRTPKEKHPFLFQEKIHPAKSEMQGVFFLSGLLAYSPVRGAWVHSFSFRSKKVRAKCIITAPVVTCSELRMWSDFAEAKIAL